MGNLGSGRSGLRGVGWGRRLHRGGWDFWDVSGEGGEKMYHCYEFGTPRRDGFLLWRKQIINFRP